MFSERASETNNAGRKLRDGANINKSLLALANCINALGKQQKKGLAYVPYRNRYSQRIFSIHLCRIYVPMLMLMSGFLLGSKLTRILKDGLSGNSRTCMIATVSFADHQYHHTINTLKYANRAKEIKTHVQVLFHVYYSLYECIWNLLDFFVILSHSLFQKNIGSVDSRVADYQRMINSLQVIMQ